MEDIKYVNLIETGVVVIEIRGAENGKLEAPVNNTFVRHTRLSWPLTHNRVCVS